MILAVSITLWVLIAACGFLTVAIMFGVGKYKSEPFWSRLLGIVSCIWQIYVYLFILGIV